MALQTAISIARQAGGLACEARIDRDRGLREGCRAEGGAVVTKGGARGRSCAPHPVWLVVACSACHSAAGASSKSRIVCQRIAASPSINQRMVVLSSTVSCASPV